MDISIDNININISTEELNTLNNTSLDNLILIITSIIENLEYTNESIDISNERTSSKIASIYNTFIEGGLFNDK